MLPVVVLFLAFSLAIGAQGPLLPTLARLDALKLASIEGDVPVRYSKGASRDVASALAARIAECRRLLAAAAGRPSIVLALLDRSDWERVSDRPYGMPHHGAADSPYVIVIPQNWRDAAPMFTGVRTHLAGALGEHGVDRYVHLAALHEVGHLLTDAALETTTEAIRTRFPFWYAEFLANYFADACLAPRAEESAFRRRGAAALAAIPRQRFTTLDDADRLLTERDPSGPPYVTTEAGGLNFARYQGFTSEMASRLRDAGLGTARIVEILRLQWARPGRQATDVLLKDFAGIAPGWGEWLVEQGAIARLREAAVRSALSVRDDQTLRLGTRRRSHGSKRLGPRASSPARGARGSDPHSHGCRAEDTEEFTRKSRMSRRISV
jgi:hypothetical protein